MARKFTKISKDAFDQMQTNVGMVLTKFDPTGVTPVQDADIAFPTTGGVTISAVPTYVDNGEDVDNCPNNTKELKSITGWDIKLATTSLGVTPEAVRLALGAADVSSNKITPRMDLKPTDFRGELWWVGDRMDGGMVAAKLSNALSSAGLTLKTTKNGKGQLSIEMMAHVSLANQDLVPVEFYSSAPSDAS